MTYERALEWVAKLNADGVNATADPRAAVPPVVLFAPPGRRYNTGCGFTADWEVWAIVPTTGNAEAWAALDGLVDAVAAVARVETATFQSYTLSADSPLLPAYRITFTEGIA